MLNINNYLQFTAKEVKSYYKEVGFYWSKKEVEVAKELSDKYFLYLIDIDKLTEEDYEPKRFQDLFKKIFQSEFWKKETKNWKITFEG